LVGEEVEEEEGSGAGEEEEAPGLVGGTSTNNKRKFPLRLRSQLMYKHLPLTGALDPAEGGGGGTSINPFKRKRSNF